MQNPYSVETTDSASLDLNDIVAYLVDVLAAPQSASAMLDDFDGLVAELEETPFIYPFVRNDELAAMGYHWAPLLDSYAAFFRINETERTVIIDRILYQPRQWQSMLGLGL